MKATQIFVAITLALSVSAGPLQERAGAQNGAASKSAGKFGQAAKADAAKAGTAKAAGAGKATANAGKVAAAAGAAGVGGAAAGKAGNSTTAATTAGKANNNTTVAANSGDVQASLTLDPKVIATGFANDGQDVPTAGQVASLTSTNNFINFCLTLPNLPITNGKQITAGSCNPAPMGAIPSSDNMPSAKFQIPKNGDTIKANTAFTITMAVQNFQTGAFVNAQENYFAAPQQLNAQGQIIGHSHVVVEQLTALDQTTPTDPKKFAFFKGLNAAAQGGVLTADVTAGLPAGFYKVSSINTAANHQPVLVPIAQHGSLDDVSYFTITDDGKPAASAATAAASGAAGAGAAAAKGTTAAANTKDALTATKGAGVSQAAAVKGATAAKGAAAANGAASSSAAAANTAATGKGAAAAANAKDAVAATTAKGAIAGQASAGKGAATANGAAAAKGVAPKTPAAGSEGKAGAKQQGKRRLGSRAFVQL